MAQCVELCFSYMLSVSLGVAESKPTGHALAPLTRNPDSKKTQPSATLAPATDVVTNGITGKPESRSREAKKPSPKAVLSTEASKPTPKARTEPKTTAKSITRTRLEPKTTAKYDENNRATTESGTESSVAAVSNPVFVHPETTTPQPRIGSTMPPLAQTTSTTASAANSSTLEMIVENSTPKFENISPDDSKTSSAVPSSAPLVAVNSTKATTVPAAKDLPSDGPALSTAEPYTKASTTEVRDKSTVQTSPSHLLEGTALLLMNGSSPSGTQLQGNFSIPATGTIFFPTKTTV